MPTKVKAKHAYSATQGQGVTLTQAASAPAPAAAAPAPIPNPLPAPTPTPVRRATNTATPNHAPVTPPRHRSSQHLDFPSDTESISGDEGHPTTQMPPPPLPPPPRPAPRPHNRGSSSQTASSSDMRVRETAASRSIDRIGEKLQGILDRNWVSEPVEGLRRTAASDMFDPSPKRRKIAIELVQEQEKDRLTNREIVRLIKHFERSTNAADTYSSLKLDEVREQWLEETLEEINLN